MSSSSNPSSLFSTSLFQSMQFWGQGECVETSLRRLSVCFHIRDYWRECASMELLLCFVFDEQQLKLNNETLNYSYWSPECGSYLPRNSCWVTNITASKIFTNCLGVHKSSSGNSYCAILPVSYNLYQQYDWLLHAVVREYIIIELSGPSHNAGHYRPP